MKEEGGIFMPVQLVQLEIPQGIQDSYVRLLDINQDKCLMEQQQLESRHLKWVLWHT